MTLAARDLTRCPRCGGIIASEQMGAMWWALDDEATSCDCGSASDDPVTLGPDLWDLVEHPEHYDQEASRRRSRTRRG